ncbi:MAG: TolC family protein [Acidobacteriota bacterium]|nr:TolC family protein [Acidobacteriota bacterium]
MNFKSSLEVRLLARMLAVLALLFGVYELPLTRAQSQNTQNPSAVKQRIAQGGAKSSKAVATVNIPEGVSLADGLTEDEAVAVALWNNATFNADLTALGFARADLKEAGLLRNPVLSILFPIGPKQLEAVVNLPIELLWQRPKRVAAAKANVGRVAESLEQNALNLVRDVRLAYADVMLAQDRAALAANVVETRRPIPIIMEARFRVGDISELEMNAARIEARTSEEEAARLRREVPIVIERLRFLLGLSAEGMALEVMPAKIEPGVPENAEVLLRDAFAARPDLRAAELALEAAGKLAKWERSKIFSVIATLDINGRGTNGFEAGPGVAVDVPIFNRNQGGISRAEAEVELALRQYVLVRQRIASEVLEAHAQLVQAREALADIRERIMPPLEEDVRIWQASFKDGEVPYLFVLQNRQQLDAMRVREAEMRATLRRARVQLDRSTGVSFGGKQ